MAGNDEDESKKQAPLPHGAESIELNPSTTGENLLSGRNSAVSSDVLDVTISRETSLQDQFSQTTKKVRKMVNTSLKLLPEDMPVDPEAVKDFPRDLLILPVYKAILEEPLPHMAVYPLFQVQEDQLDETVKQMHKRIMNSPTYKTFLEETRNLLTYCLQERKLRHNVQEHLKLREEEMHDLIAKHERDPRVPKIISLADHWRKENIDSEQKIQNLINEMNMATLDLKTLENKLNAMAKKHDRMEIQLNKGRMCELDKERIEEHLMLKEKECLSKADVIHDLEATVEEMKTKAAAKEKEYIAKIEAKPARVAWKIASLTRELEVLTLEKEYKVQEVKELQEYVNHLIAENSKSLENIKILMETRKHMRHQRQSLEQKHQALVSRNIGIQKKLDQKAAKTETQEKELLLSQKEVQILKSQLSTMKSKFNDERDNHMLTIRKLAKKQLEINDLISQLKDAHIDVLSLKQARNEAKEAVANTEEQNFQMRKTNQLERQKVTFLQRKLKISGNHIHTAISTAHTLLLQLDKAEEQLNLADQQLNRSKTESSRTKTMIQYIERLLENSEDMVRLQTTENDALILSKRKLTKALYFCQRSENHLANEVSQLMCTKTTMEDARHVQKLMMDFVENERDGAIRLNGIKDNTIVIMRRDQIMKVAQLANAYADVSKLKLKIGDAQVQLTNQKRDIYSLNSALRKAEFHARDVETWCKNLMHQRDMFGVKLLQQKSECQLLSMKLAKLEQTLYLANRLCVEKGNDVNILKKEINHLRQRIKRLKNTESVNVDLRGEISYLSKQVCLETNKRVALENMIPQRVHPFSDLKNTYPTKYELLQKMHRLQKMSIVKFQECISLQKELSIRDDHILTYQAAIIRRDKFEDLTAVPELKKIVREKDNKIKALTAEVRMLYYYNDIDAKMTVDHGNELSSVKGELSKLKTKSVTRPSKASTKPGAKSEGTLKPTPPTVKPVRSLNRNQSNRRTLPATRTYKKTTGKAHIGSDSLH